MSIKVKVGVTTDPKTKRSFYQNQFENFYNWQILETFTCREDASKCAILYSEYYGYNLEPEEPETGLIWYVYRFEFEEN